VLEDIEDFILLKAFKEGPAKTNLNGIQQAIKDDLN